jgi:DNA-binding NarL/FixJ family response regulator
MQKPIKIFIDSRIKVADKLKIYLEHDSTSNIAIINTYKDAWLLEEIESHQKVLLLLFCKNEQESINYIKKLKRNIPNLLCLLLINENSRNYMFDALNSGINGIAFENSALCVICDNIDQVLKGGMPLSSQLTKFIYESWLEKTMLNEQCLQKITLREKEILILLAKGHLYKEIAAHLSISTLTVKNHLKNIYRKIGVSNRSEAIVRFLGK